MVKIWTIDESNPLISVIYVKLQLKGRFYGGYGNISLLILFGIKMLQSISGHNFVTYQYWSYFKEFPEIQAINSDEH